MAPAKVFQLSADALGSKIVTIHVGPKRKVFTFHKKLLCDRSDFFFKAFNGGFKEATTGVMYLPEDDVDALDSLIVYVYQDLLPGFPSLKYPDSDLEYGGYLEKIIYPLFALAEKLCLNELANRVMDLIQDTGMKYNCIPGSQAEGGIYLIYAITPADSKLRVYSVLMQIFNHHGLDTKTAEEEDAEMGKNLAELARH
ncbi:hypothetical protein IFR05_006658 [Cadophora sp. M221]|nr:hypothetical protein IFR05_006658 [Cadophora sp. M221]